MRGLIAASLYVSLLLSSVFAENTSSGNSATGNRLETRRS